MGKVSGLQRERDEVVTSHACSVVLLTVFSSNQLISFLREHYSHLCIACLLTMLCRIQKQPLLLVACEDGWLYMFSIEPLASGSECTLLFQHRSVCVCVSMCACDDSDDDGCCVIVIWKYMLNVYSFSLSFSCKCRALCSPWSTPFWQILDPPVSCPAIVVETSSAFKHSRRVKFKYKYVS